MGDKSPRKETKKPKKDAKKGSSPVSLTSVVTKPK
jgi:hypothetical protein